jgi:hypothetical protein
METSDTRTADAAEAAAVEAPDARTADAAEAAAMETAARSAGIAAVVTAAGKARGARGNCEDHYENFLHLHFTSFFPCFRHNRLGQQLDTF